MQGNMDIPVNFIWIISFFSDGAFEYGGGSTFLGYVGTNAELLCVYSVILCNVIPL
jgi:hypothetical protein